MVSSKVVRRGALSLGLFAVIAAGGCGADEATARAGGDAGADVTVGACAAPATSCGTSCVDMSTDPAHCGGCDVACASGASCCGGACSTSCALTVASIEPSVSWVSGETWHTIRGAGFVKGMRVFVGDARASVRVEDPTTATVLVPPGPPGTVDLTVALGAARSTRLGVFRYQRGSLKTPWQQKPMSTVRGEWPAVAVGKDGRVLIAGGAKTPDVPSTTLGTGEIFTRSTEQVTAAKGTMATPRWRSAAVTLLSGKILVVGGTCGNQDEVSSACVGNPALADLFDPATDTFAPTRVPMTVPRVHARAVLLPDGRVLIASNNDPRLEVYDPDTDSFKVVPHAVRHYNGVLSRLRDGRVLVAGGSDTVLAELFDPDTDTLTPTGPLAKKRGMGTSNTLPDGRVLVIGGASEIWTGGTLELLNTVEAFDPKTGTFGVLPYTLSSFRQSHTSALVLDGTVLVMGGYVTDCASLTDTVDQIDPTAGRVTPFDKLPNKNTEWNSVRLHDGSVIAVGGGACGASFARPDLDFLPGDPTPR